MRKRYSAVLEELSTLKQTIDVFLSATKRQKIANQRLSQLETANTPLFDIPGLKTGLKQKYCSVLEETHKQQCSSMHIFTSFVPMFINQARMCISMVMNKGIPHEMIKCHLFPSLQTYGEFSDILEQLCSTLPVVVAKRRLDDAIADFEQIQSMFE
ncbi:hypothetical protein PCE1_001089 [Barthelona sp. PCE]